MSKPIPKHKLLGFDSNEEYLFSCWCKEIGLEYKYKPRTFYLSDPVKIPQQKTRSIAEAHLLREHTYTYDFEVSLQALRHVLSSLTGTIFHVVDIRIHPLEKGLKNAIITTEDVICIDVKGSNFKGSQRTSDVVFPVNMKWVFAKYGVYINSLVPDRLFESTFFPEEALVTDGGKDKCKKVKGELTPLRSMVKTIKDVL